MVGEEDGEELGKDRGELWGGCEVAPWADGGGGGVIAVGWVEEGVAHVFGDGQGAVEADLAVEFEKERGRRGRGCWGG